MHNLKKNVNFQIKTDKFWCIINSFKAHYFKDKVINVPSGYISTTKLEHALVQLFTVIFHEDLIIISETAYTQTHTHTYME